MGALPPGIDPATTPAQPPPDGVVSDFNKPAILASTTIVIVAIVIYLNVSVLSIRLFTKIKNKTGIVLDDWCAVVAGVLSISLGAVLILGRDGGKHTWDMSLAQASEPRATKIMYALSLLVGPAVYMGKVAFLALYRRLFGHLRWVTWSIYIAAVVGLLIPVMTPVDAILCAPPKGSSWGVPNPKCPGSFNYGIPQGVASLVLDIYIMVLPLPIIARLKLDRKKKMSILSIFLLGFLAVVADAIVMKYRVNILRGWDLAYAGYVIALCGVVESGISVVCSSMPTMAAFARLPMWHSGYTLTIRSLFRSTARYSSGSGRGFRTTSKAKSYGGTPKLPSTPKTPSSRRRDPYSIAMPTTIDGSATQLTMIGNESMELRDGANAVLKPEVTRNTAANTEKPECKGIQKTVDIEQWHEDRGPWVPRDLV